MGTLLLVLAFCLPVERMRENVAVSVDSMIKDPEEVADNAFAQYVWSEKETYTDAIMVQNAIERIPGKNVFEEAMWGLSHRLGRGGLDAGGFSESLSFGGRDGAVLSA